MPDPDKEARDLRKADADIRRATKAALAQDRVVRELLTRRHDASEAKQLLGTMRDSLELLETHRSQIVRNLVESRRGRGNAQESPLTSDRRADKAEAWMQSLARVRELFAEYSETRQDNRAAQREILNLDPATPLSPQDRERFLALGWREHHALLAYLEELERCSQQCAWDHEEPAGPA